MTPSFTYFCLHPTLSAHPPPPLHKLWGILAQLHYVVGGIATHILKCSNFANLYLKNTNKTGTSGWTSEGKGFMLSSNKTNYSGHLCEDNAIYLKTIRSELTEIQPIHGHFGNKININMFSVKKYPCKEMLYSLERPHLHNFNTLIIIIKPNWWFLMKSCIIQGCHIDGLWEFRLITMDLGDISTWTFHTAQKNTEKYGGHSYNC